MTCLDPNAASGLLRSLRPLLAGCGLASAWLCQLGCAVVIVDTDGEAPTTTGPEESGETAPEASCPDTESPAAPAQVVVTGAKSAAFVGGFLHLEAVADGAPAYLVLAVDGPGVAHVVAVPEELLGPANLVQIADGVHARVKAGPVGTTVDVLSTKDPAAPQLLAQRDVSGQPGPVFAAAEQHVFFCDLLPGFEESSLVAVDLSDPAEPGGPIGFESKMCNAFPDGGMAANGPTWMAWGKDYDVNVYSVGKDGDQKIGDYWYNPDGIHQYGAVVFASSDATRVVVDPGNDSEMFLFDLGAQKPLAVHHAYFGIEGPKYLLGVADSIAYMATPGAVRAYDVSNVNSVELLPYEAIVDLGAGARLLASSPDHLAIADAGGALHLVPRASPGKVGPLEVYDAPPLPPLEPCAP